MCCVHVSYFPASHYQRYYTLELEDFLPLYEIDESTITMLSMGEYLVLFVPSHQLLLTVSYQSTSQDGNISSSMKAHVSVMALQTQENSKPCTCLSIMVVTDEFVWLTIWLACGVCTEPSLSTAFLHYLTPGFKMPNWQLRSKEVS